jgi:hypothetical protein
LSNLDVGFGWAVIDSPVLGGKLLLVEANGVSGIPGRHADLPIYTLDEFKALGSFSDASVPSVADLRSVHAAKVALGGTVARPDTPPAPSACPSCGASLRAGKCGFCG